MVGFYSIRKLLDTYKVKDTTKSELYPILWHPNRQNVDYLNWHHIDKLYDLENSSYEQRNIRFICDLFIHSYVFLIEGQPKFEGVYISTDKIRNKKIYFLSADLIVNIFRLVGRDYPSQGRFTRDPVTLELHGTAS